MKMLKKKKSFSSLITPNLFQNITYYQYLLSMELSTVKVGDAACHICTGGHGHQAITL